MVAGFTEKPGLEKGFASVFDERIAPRLKILEDDRSGLRHRTRRDMMVLLAVSVGLAVLMVILWGLKAAPLALLPVMVGGVLAYLLYRRRNTAWQDLLVDAVMPPICAFLGNISYDRDGAADDFARPFQDLGVVRDSDKGILTHHFSGSHRNTGFEFVHAELQKTTGKRKKNRNRTSVFSGLLFRINVPAHVPTPVVITPDMGPAMEKFGRFLKHPALQSIPTIQTGKAHFDDRFDVYSTDEDMAKSLLTERFLDALLSINDSESGASTGIPTLAAAFSNDMFYMALARYQSAFSIGPLNFQTNRPFMETGSLLREEIDLEATIHGLFDDIGIAHRIIDRLHGH